MIERISSGISGLDSLLQGGFPKGSASLIVGPPGSGKSTLVREITYSSLKQNLKVIYITTTEPVSNVLKQMRINGWEVNGYVGKELIFIDGYSWRVPSELREKQEFQLSSIVKLNELDNLVLKAIQKLGSEKGKIVMIFDTVSDLLLHSEKQSVFKLLQLITAKIKAVNGTSFIVLEGGLHEPRDVATISYITDGTIEMKIEEDKRYLRIVRMIDTVHPLKWILFEIGHGITIKVEEFFK